MCQLSSSPDLSADGGEDPRCLLVGEPVGDETGEASSGEEGGEGGSAGRSLCKGRIWRMTGRLSSLLVNGCYYACCDCDSNETADMGLENGLGGDRSHTPCFPLPLPFVWQLGPASWSW